MGPYTDTKHTHSSINYIGVALPPVVNVMSL